MKVDLQLRMSKVVLIARHDDRPYIRGKKWSPDALRQEQNENVEARLPYF